MMGIIKKIIDHFTPKPENWLIDKSEQTKWTVHCKGCGSIFNIDPYKSSRHNEEAHNNSNNEYITFTAWNYKCPSCGKMHTATQEIFFNIH